MLGKTFKTPFTKLRFAFFLVWLVLLPLPGFSGNALALSLIHI